MQCGKFSGVLYTTPNFNYPKRGERGREGERERGREGERERGREGERERGREGES